MTKNGNIGGNPIRRGNGRHDPLRPKIAEATERHFVQEGAAKRVGPGPAMGIARSQSAIDPRDYVAFVQDARYNAPFSIEGYSSQAWRSQSDKDS